MDEGGGVFFITQSARAVENQGFPSCETACAACEVTPHNNRVFQTLPEAGWAGRVKNRGFVFISHIGSGDFGKFVGS